MMCPTCNESFDDCGYADPEDNYVIKHKNCLIQNKSKVKEEDPVIKNKYDKEYEDRIEDTVSFLNLIKQIDTEDLIILGDSIAWDLERDSDSYCTKMMKWSAEIKKVINSRK